MTANVSARTSGFIRIARSILRADIYVAAATATLARAVLARRVHGARDLAT
jgi:hypothetical protein